MSSNRPVLGALLALLALGGGVAASAAPAAIPGLAPSVPAPADSAARASGSGAGASAATAPASAPAPAAFPLSSLSTALLESRQTLRSAERTLRRPLHVDDWQREIEQLTASSQHAAGAERAIPEDQRTFRALFSAANEWRILGLRAELAAEAVQRRLDALEALDAQLRLLRQRWELTRLELARAAPEGGVPTDAIDQVFASIASAEARTRTEIEYALEVQSKLTELQLQVDDGVAWVEETARAERARLLQIDSPPLWAALSAPAATAAASVPWHENLRLLGSVLRSPRRLAFGLAVLVLLLLLLRAAGRGLAGFAPTDRLSTVGLALVNQPIRAALLVTLTLQILLFPRAPAVFYELLALAIMAVLGLLGGRIVVPALRPYYAGLLLLGVADRLRTVLLAPSLGSRLLLLAIGIVAFAGLAWGMRPGSPARSALTGRWWDAVVALCLAGAAFFATAIGSNVVGNLSLADLLTSSTLTAGLSALLLHHLVALASVLLRWWAGRPQARLRSLQVHGSDLVAGGTRLLVALAVAIWALFTLNSFTVAPAVSGWLREMLSRRYVVGALDLALGDVVAFVVGLVASVLFARLVSFLLAEEVLPRTRVPRGRATAIVTIVRYLLLAIGFLAAVAMSGFEINRLTLLISAFGIGVGFGLQNIISNFVAGLILILERPIEVDDVVELGQLTGTVRRIGIRSSLVRTFDGASVIVPNSNLISDQVVNWTHSDKLRRIEVQVGVAYGTTPEKVLELLHRAAASHPRVLSHPPPNALFVAFGDSALDFSLRFWTVDFDHWMTVRSEVLAAIDAALRGAGIEVPFPQRDLHLRSVDPAARRALRDAPQEALRDAPQPPPAR
ncbi:MAG: mechanosensitive ion channel [Acidobacteria bacterium]|nr:mechanosensitive ion channel [Acidobacteriota bacterium]